MTASAADVVGIFDSDLRQLVPEGRPIKASITEPSKVMEHPLEDGATVADHRVFLPVEIELTMLVPLETFQRLRAIFRQTETVTVQTNAASYDNMIIETLPHDVTPDAFDMLPVAAKFREVQFVDVQFQALPPRAVGKSANGNASRNASTVKKGEQSGKPAAAEVQRKASALYKKARARGLFGGP